MKYFNKLLNNLLNIINKMEVTYTIFSLLKDKKLKYDDKLIWQLGDHKDFFKFYNKNIDITCGKDTCTIHICGITQYHTTYESYENMLKIVDKHNIIYLSRYITKTLMPFSKDDINEHGLVLLKFKYVEDNKIKEVDTDSDSD